MPQPARVETSADGVARGCCGAPGRARTCNHYYHDYYHDYHDYHDHYHYDHHYSDISLIGATCMEL